MYLTTAQEMRDLDRYAIETIGIPGVVLMENAGKAVARLLTDRLPRPATTAESCLWQPGIWPPPAGKWPFGWRDRKKS
ncbi:MAG: hypothetical protein AB2404_10285 [Planifilum fimeticola]